MTSTMQPIKNILQRPNSKTPAPPAPADPPKNSIKQYLFYTFSHFKRRMYDNKYKGYLSYDK